MLSLLDESDYSNLAGGARGDLKNNMKSGISQYLSMELTILPEHSRIPMSSLKEEMMAVRLLAAIECTATFTPVSGCGEDVVIDHQEKAREVLNQILTTVAQVPFCLFPATGSPDRSPPITVHLLAFYLRACLSNKALKEFKIEEFCEEVKSFLVSDQEAYVRLVIAS